MINEHPLDFISVPNSCARIGLTPCPGTVSVGLSESIVQLKESGVIALLTLMSPEEMKEYDIIDISGLCRHHGILWFHLPITVNKAPDIRFLSAWGKVKDQIHALLDQNCNVAIHDKHGSGRTGLISSQILMERGIKLEDAVELIKSVKPTALEVPSQVAYLGKVDQHLAMNPTRYQQSA